MKSIHEQPVLLIALALGCAAAGCVGNVSGEYERRGDGSLPPPGTDAMVDLDADVTRDTGRPPAADAAPDGAVDSGGGTADSGVRDTGTPPPLEPCDGVRCGTGAECNAVTGECECADGFIASGGGCDPILPGDPQGRTSTEMCDAWRAGHVENARPAWTDGPTACDPGTMAPEAYGDTTRRINLFRWLTGLPAVSHDASRNAAMQECAIMMDQQGALSHEPPATWACYTTAGAGAAGSSNLALGTSSPGGAIDLYMGDARVASLGHRRWILSNNLGRVGIGFAGRAQCLGVFDMSGSGDRQWTSFPNAGPAPVETTGYVWSFNSHSINLRDATVLMERLDATPVEIPVTTSYIASSYGPPASVGWTPSTRAVAGATYRITIGGLSIPDISYEVEVIDCP